MRNGILAGFIFRRHKVEFYGYKYKPFCLQVKVVVKNFKCVALFILAAPCCGLRPPELVDTSDQPLVERWRKCSSAGRPLVPASTTGLCPDYYLITLQFIGYTMLRSQTA
jgi:hypothetical protein